MSLVGLSGSTLGIIVALVVAGFFVGNLMAARPNAHQMRTADLRLLARQMHLYPKLLSCPDWLLPTYQQAQSTPDNPKSAWHEPKKTPLVCQYTLVADEFSLPSLCYVMQDGCWWLTEESPNLKAQALHAVALGLPDDMKHLVLGLQMKANSISIFWQDERYQRHQKAYKLDKTQAQNSLNALKQALETWAKQVQQAA